MSFTVKEKDGRKVIEGKYIPDGFSCKCKECKYEIQIPKCTTDEQIKGIVELIERV